MSNKVNIAIDAMGGENSPQKIIEGIRISLKSNKENFFYLYGQQESVSEKELAKITYCKKNTVKLLMQMMSFWITKVHLLQQKEVKNQVCGKQ